MCFRKRDLFGFCLCLINVCVLCNIDHDDARVNNNTYTNDDEDKLADLYEDSAQGSVDVNGKDQNGHRAENNTEVLQLIEYLHSDFVHLLENVTRRSGAVKFGELSLDDLNENVKASILENRSSPASDEGRRRMFYEIADAANAFLRDLVDDKEFDTDKEDIMKSVDDLTKSHYAYICKQYHICRSTTSTNLLTYFLDYMTVIVRFSEWTLEGFLPHLYDMVHDIHLEPLMTQVQTTKLKDSLLSLDKLPVEEVRSQFEWLHKLLLANFNQDLPEHDKDYPLLKFLDANTVLPAETSRRLDRCRNELIDWWYDDYDDLRNTFSKVLDTTWNVTIGSWDNATMDKGRELISKRMEPSVTLTTIPTTVSDDT